MPDSLRRSTRARKKVETIYDSAEKASRDSLASSRSPSPQKKNASPKKKKTVSPKKKDSSPKKKKVEKTRVRKEKDDDDASMTSSEPVEEHSDQEAEEHEDEVMEENSVNENDDEDIESESEEEEEEEEEEFQPVTESSKKRKSPGKPQDIDQELEGIETIKGRIQVSKGSGLTRRQAVSVLTAMAKKVATPGETSENSLAISLLLSFRDDTKKSKRRGNNDSYYTAGIRKIVEKVVDDHKEDANATEVNLINLVLRSVGGTTMLPTDTDLEEMSDEDWKEKLENLKNEMAETPVDSVLIAIKPGKVTTKTQQACHEYYKIYEEFWYELAACVLGSTPEENAPFSNERIQDILSRLIELSDVDLPDVRFAICSAVYQIGLAVLEHTVELKAKTKTAERQLTVAKRSKSSRKAASLEEKIDSWNRAVSDLEACVQEMTALAVFIKRYRDSAEQIRVLSMEALTKYGQSRPDIFISSKYLKYVGWMLSDRDSSVRLAAMKALLTPFQKEIDTSAMSAVINKFILRIADCVLDVDTKVQEVAMELLLHLLRNDYFEDIEEDSVWNQINIRALANDTTPLVRKNALYFVIEQLGAFDSGPAKSENEAVEQISQLVQWIAATISEGAIPIEHIRYHLADFVVSSLRSMPEHYGLIQNSRALLRALQNEQNRKSDVQGGKSDEQRLDIVKQRVLLRLLVSAAQAEMGDDTVDTQLLDPDLAEARKAEQESSRTKESSKKQTNHKSKNSQEEFTLALLQSLPKLLQSFKSETPVLQSLTELPQYFLTTVLNLSSQKKNFQSLLKSLAQIVFESTDHKCISNSCYAIVLLACGDHALSDEALVVLKEVCRKLRDSLFRLLEEHKDLEGEKSGDESIAEEVKQNEANLRDAISLCLRRLCIFCKRYDVANVWADDGDKDETLESISKAITEYLSGQLKIREFEDRHNVEVPEIWSEEAASSHPVIADSVYNGLGILLALAAWRLSEEIEKIDKGKDDYTEEEIENHVVLLLRDSIRNLLVYCFEQHPPCNYSNEIPEDHEVFADQVQEHALKVSGDLRSLFIRAWTSAKSPFLVACALTDDSPIIAAGTRFLRSKVSKLREIEDYDAIQRLMFPVARGLGTNWATGNRHEAAAILSCISGAGKETHDVVQSLSRVMKKINPIRLLEAHMACLVKEFEGWADAEPEEPSDRPTEEEMAEFEEESKKHRARFEEIEKMAKCLSSSLGVAQIRDKKLAPALLGLVREGVRFSFSTNHVGSEEQLALGIRLPFLLLLSKYLVWIKRNKQYKEVLTKDLNEKETDLRNHPEFDEVYENDLMALESFRKQGDLGDFVVIEDETHTKIDSVQGETTLASTRAGTATIGTPRTSFGSSVSSIRTKRSGLESIREEDPSVEKGAEESSGHSTPSQTERPNPSSIHTGTSISTLGQQGFGESTVGPSLTNEAESDEDSPNSTPPPSKRSKRSSIHTGTSISTLGPMTLGDSTVNSPADESSKMTE